MANLKSIRDRIKSVKNTKKITEAMRLVAAAKVRRAQEQVIATRPFADRLAQVLYGLQTRLRFEEANLPLLSRRTVKTVGHSGDFGRSGFVRCVQLQRDSPCREPVRRNCKRKGSQLPLCAWWVVKPPSTSSAVTSRSPKPS